MIDTSHSSSQPYGICRTCGRYVPLRLMVGEGYCSPACAMAFAQCITCGRFVPSDDIYDAFFCSEECSVQYKFLKTLGPRPVIIASDQSLNDDDILI